MIERRQFLLAGVGLLAGAPRLYAQDAKLPVVATITIIADFVKNVGGNRVAVTSLVGPNGDAHTYQPKPSDAKALAAAKLVVENGFGLEGFMARLVKASGTHATVIEATKGITPRKGDEEEHGGIDPHAWQSVANAKIYVANIRDGLAGVDQAGQPVYAANADKYLKQLDDLEAEVKAGIAKIPEANRRIVSSHDAFGYFAAAYGIEFIPAQGLSTDAEPTPKRVAELIRQVKKEKVRAVFFENMSNPQIIKRISQETGAVVGGTLYADALSDAKGPASTYIDMIRYNVRTLSAALGGTA